MAYGSTQLDMPRLQRFAAKVAKETRHPLADEMVIEWEAKRISRRVVTTKHVLGFIPKQTTSMVQESVKVPKVALPRHWELHRRNYHIHNGKSEYYECFIWALLPDGALKFAWRYEDYYLNGRPADLGGHLRDMSEDDVLRLDRKPKQHELHKGGWHTWGDREDGAILRHAKGVGLSLRLKAFL